jgi:hypothetical protein
VATNAKKIPKEEEKGASNRFILPRKISGGLSNSTPTKRQVSKHQVSKRLVSKRPVSKRHVYRTSGFKTSGFKTASF